MLDPSLSNCLLVGEVGVVGKVVSGGQGSVLFGGGIPIFILGLGKGSCNKSTCSNQVYTVLLSSKF